LVDSAEDAHFHWLASDGKRLSGSKRDLLTALHEGALQPTALVWRAGWAEWLPANRVAALAGAIPEANREAVQEPKRDPAIVTPPAIPSERTPAVVPRAPVSAAPRSSLSPGRAQPPPAPVRAKPSAPPPPKRELTPPTAAANAASARAILPNAPATNAAPLNATLPHAPHTPAVKATPVDPHEAARDTLNPSSFGTIGAPRRTQPAAAVVRRDSAPLASPVRGRSALPTLTEEGTVQSATATLRPPGAVPPPARGVPALDSSGSFSFEKRSAAITPIPGFGPPGGTFETVPPAGLPPRLAPDPVRPSAPVTAGAPVTAPPPQAALTPAIDEPAAAANALPPVVNKALLADATPASIEPALDSTLEVVARVPPEARRTPVEPLRAARPVLDSSSEDMLARTLQRNSLVKIGRIAVDSRTVVMALSALCGALLVAVAALYLSRAHRSVPQPVAPVSVSMPPAASPAAPPGCRLAMPAALIATNIERSVSPYATKVGSDPALALGFAATKTKGIGLRLKPDTLDTQPAFEEEGKDAVRGVVPLTRSGSLAFFVDRDDSALRSAHTVDEIPPFTVGVSDAGFSRVVAGSTSLVWPLDASVKITEPRAAAAGPFGYGVTFRRGGQSGNVLLGFVASDGSKKSELVAIPGTPKFLGTPVIAGSAAGVLVAFAGRDATDAPWKLLVSLTKPGEAPRAARELVTGSGGGAISPALSALAPDHWLVQWTEGVSGQYQVRVQSFAANLSAIGASVLVSPKGANAGQGSLATFSGGAATLFILTTAGHDELWGATLSCL
jgi:hypothetical protein